MTKIPSVWGDQRRLRVVLDNIVFNALKYTSTGGTITLEAHRAVRNGNSPSDRVTISISDTGPGVPPAFRDRVFEKFFRLEHQQPDDRSHARGAGIGLYMCRQIVELQGGHIACTTGNEERGARFTVDLPVDGSVTLPVVGEYAG
jgi:two-component system, NtrC family, sensor histidine kinase KinB